MFTKVVFAALALIVVQAQNFQIVDQCNNVLADLGMIEGVFCDAISAANNTYQLTLVNPPINAQCTNLAGQTPCLGQVGKDCEQPGC
ncbi:hypothetical protein BDZ89DRAFT_1130891 [Hymenopellis radicata]|nr:hypothetical protein BDZ89DRAFT_1130891 [Hymenopellis radicata]